MDSDEAASVTAENADKSSGHIAEVIWTALNSDSDYVDDALKHLAGNRAFCEGLFDRMQDMLVSLRDKYGMDFERCWMAVCLFATADMKPDDITEYFGYMTTRMALEGRPPPDTPESAAEKATQARAVVDLGAEVFGDSK